MKTRDLFIAGALTIGGVTSTAAGLIDSSTPLTPVQKTEVLLGVGLLGSAAVFAISKSAKAAKSVRENITVVKREPS